VPAAWSSRAGRAESSAAGSPAGGPGMSGMSGALTAARLPSAASPAPAVAARGRRRQPAARKPRRQAVPRRAQHPLAAARPRGAGRRGGRHLRRAATAARVSQASYVCRAGSARARAPETSADDAPTNAGAHGGALDRVGVGGLRVVAGADVLERRVGDRQPAPVVEGLVGLDLALVGEADRRQGPVGVAAREAHLERQRVGGRLPRAGEEQVEPGDDGAGVDVGDDLRGRGDLVLPVAFVPAQGLDLEADLVGRDRPAQVAGRLGGQLGVGPVVCGMRVGGHGSSWDRLRARARAWAGRGVRRRRSRRARRAPRR
jgi:hypothetical protein